MDCTSKKTRLLCTFMCIANANPGGNAVGGFLFGHGHVCWLGLQSIDRSSVSVIEYYRGFSPLPNRSMDMEHGTSGRGTQGCQMVKFDPFLSLDCARVEGLGAQGGGCGSAIQGKEGIKFCCVA